MTDMLKVGVMVGREWSFPPAFIEEVNRRNEGVYAEYVKLGGTIQNEPNEYRVIIDRISHEIPYYRAYLKNAVLQGTYVINNPFMWSADDKFFEASLATKLGVASPRTVVLPNKDYIEGIVTESLRNLVFPLDWKAITDYVGLPAILKDAWGGGWRHVYKVNTIDELIAAYDQTGQLTMVLQEFIEWDHYVRCMCIGQDVVMPIKYDPRERRYHVEHAHLSADLGAGLGPEARLGHRAPGDQKKTVEFFVSDRVAKEIDFMNPAPDMDVNSITPFYFDWVVNAMADMVIRRAKRDDWQGYSYPWGKYVRD